MANKSSEYHFARLLAILRNASASLPEKVIISDSP